MKLSSAFDESSLLNGCSGKTSPVMDEVAAATGTQMSYLDKSNSMRLIESTDYVPVDSFNGVFSLSDELGVNTFAYGGAGTIYGCFNYSNQNIASYSKTYAGSTIIASAYAVADLGSADGDTSSPGSDTSDLATQEGILIGASKDGLHVYAEEGSAKAWTPLKLEDSSDEIEVYNLFAVGRTFFAACRIGPSAGLLTFNASAVSSAIHKADGKIARSGWNLVVPPADILEHSGQCSRISFIRSISFEIGTRTVDAYSMAYAKQDGSGSYAVLFNEVSNNWEWIEMEWPGTGMIAGIVPINNASFPEMVGTTDNGESSGDQAFDPGEDIPLVNAASISIVPMSQVEAGWKNITGNSNIEASVEALKLKTENGYAVLAVIADSTNLASLNADGVEEMDKGKESLFIFKNSHNENRWQQRRPWVILDSTDPLPKHLESESLYSVTPKMSSIANGTGKEFHTHWQEAFQVVRKEGTADIEFQNPERQSDWTPPEGSVQLFNDTAEQSSVSLTIDIQDILDVDAVDPDTLEPITAERELQEAWLCISRPGSELQGTVWLDNIMDAEDYPYVWKWDGRSWVRELRPETGTIRGYFDTSGVLVQSVSKAYAAVPVQLNEEGIPVSIAFGKPTEQEYSDLKMLRASAELQSIEGRKCIVADISIAGFEIPWFNKQVEFKIVLKHQYEDVSSKSVLTHIAYDGDQKWTARIRGGSALCTQRILYSQTGIFSGTGNGIEGNKTSCALSVHNSSDAWGYSLSERDEELLRKLAGEGRDDGIEIFKQHSFRSSSSSMPHNATLFAGTAFLASDSTGLSFSKISADSAGTADLIPVNSFAPQMKAESGYASFNGTFNWTKPILDGSASIQGTLTVSIPSMTVCDGSNYEGNWNEYFVNAPYLPADQDKTYCLVDAEGNGSNAYAYTYGTPDILNGNTLKKTPIFEVFGNSEEYAFHHTDGYGCIVPVQFDGANRPNLGTAVPFKQITASAKQGGRQMVRLLASNCMWTLPKESASSAEISVASLTDQNASAALMECAMPCLNFHLDPVTSEAKESFARFVPGDTSTLADDNKWKDCGILTTVTVELQTETVEEDGVQVDRQYQTLHLVAERCPEADAPNLEDSETLKTYRNFSLETGCPIWIDGTPYWLDLNDYVDNLASPEEPDTPDPDDPDAPDPDAPDPDDPDPDDPDAQDPDTPDPDAPTPDPESDEDNGSILSDISYRLVRIPNLHSLNELVESIDLEDDLHQEDVDSLFPNFPSSDEGSGGDENEGNEASSEEQYALLQANFEKRIRILSLWLCNYSDDSECIQDFQDIILERTQMNVLDDRFDLLFQFSTAYDESIPVTWTALASANSAKPVQEAMDIESPEAMEWTYLKSGAYTLVSFLPTSDHKVRMEAIPLTLASLTVPEPQAGISENNSNGSIFSALSRKAMNATVDASSPKILTMNENGMVQFASAVSSGDIPYVQYANLKQWNKPESGSPSKIVVKKRPAANGVGNANAWDLHEESIDGYGWNQWDTSRYEGGNIPFIYDSGSWPIFVPKLGAIYYVTQRHMTASPKYTPGYYAYVNDATGSLSECYAKFPSFSSRSGAEDGTSYWDDWLSSVMHTYVLALGTTIENSISVGKAYAANISMHDSLSDWIKVRQKQGGGTDWIHGGTFKMSDAVLLPSMNSTFDSIIDECNPSRKIAFCVDIREGNSAAGAAIGQRIYREMSTTFNIPRICGLFERSSSNETIFGITKMMDLLGSTNAYDVQVENVPVAGNAAPFKSLSIISAGINGSELVWNWEAAVAPRDASTEGNSSWLVGYYGTAHLTYPNSSSTSSYATTTCTGVYAASTKGEMLKIKSPEQNAPEGSEDEDIVYYNQQGFYVKVKRNRDGGESLPSGSGSSEGTSSSPASLSGSESMASKRAIIDMTAVKAYNSPIIMGLYETGGLILYYGQKCFDDSILSVNRLAEGTEDDELNTIRIKTSEWTSAIDFDGTVDEDEAVTQDEIDEMYASKAKASDILDMWLPSETSEIQAVAASFNATTTQRSHIASKLAYAAGRTSANVSLTASEKQIYNAILKHCLGTEAKAETIAEADKRFIESCEYSPNNSETSQWIDIPIYIRNRQTGEIEEPKEELTTISTSVQNGRIRVSVGSAEGNVYYRDLNPLHADRYISYIPMPYLSDSEQQAIRTSLSSGLDYKSLGTENLKNFIKPAASDQQQSALIAQAIKIGWLQQEWLLKNANVANQNKFIALQNSKASIAKDSRLWLYDRSTDLNYRFETNDPRTDKVNGNAYMPYVKERLWHWVIGETKTKVKAYANTPYVEKRSGRLEWAVVDARNGGAVFHTGVRAAKGVYPSLVKFNGKQCWSFGGKTDFGTAASPKAIEAVSNGVPYVTGNEWLIKEYGKTSPTKMGIASSEAVQLTAVIGDPTDHWYIDPAPSSSSQEAVDLKYSTEASKSNEVSFKAKQKQFWKLTNVQRVLDNGTVQAAVSSYLTSIEVKNGETIANCPYVLQEAKKIIVDNKNESPVWRSKSNIALAKLGSMFLQNSGTAWSIASASGALTQSLPAASASNGLSPYWMGKSGKSFWLPPDGAPDSTEIPYSNDASPISTIGSRWTSYSQSFNENGKRDERTWELIGISSNDSDKFVPKDVKFSGVTWNVWTVDGKYLHARNTADGKLVCTTSSTADRRYVCRTDDWQKPKLAKGNADIWQWKMRKPNGTFINGFTIITEDGECPYNSIEEVCVWKNGKVIENVEPDASLQLRIADAFRENGDPILQWSAVGYDWSMDYEAPPAGQPEMRVVPSWNGRRCTFQWQVYHKTRAGENWANAVQTASATQCPLVKTAKKSWQVVDSAGKWIDTGIQVSMPLAGKGLETDGIAEIRTSQTIRSHSEKRWVSGNESEKSWTPLASIFVDAFEEVSEGVLGSIKTPYYKKEGMIWDVLPAEELFDSDNGSGESVHISDEVNNTWNEYVESPEGNKSGNGYTIYIGWQVVTGTQKYNNYCTVVSSSTGAMFKWKQNNKDWRFEKIELVNRRDGSLDKIVILCSQGWIVASGPISYANKGREIKAIEWQSAVNPVKKVLNKLNALLAYKWKSWTSNTYGEFAAVGTSGIYVYSPDCINFEASMPYGIEAEMLEVVWNETNGEFIIRAIAPTVGDGSGQTVTPEEEEQEDDFEMEHALQLDKRAPGGRALSVSLLSDETIYKHKHKNCSGKTETQWYKFSPSLSYFEEIPSNSPDLTPAVKAGAELIIPDNQYKWIANGYTWSWVYTKRDVKGKALGSGYTGKKGEKWYWMWGSNDAGGSGTGSLSYITISKNRKKVAYGFPDLIRFIRSYKKIYTESMEFLGGVSTFITSERESVDEARKALMVSYKELAEMGSSGLEMYSPKLQVAYRLYLQAKKLRDDSHYAQNDCWDTYLQKIGQSLALEHKDFFNKAKRAMWTAQAFRNYYESLAKKAGG